VKLVKLLFFLMEVKRMKRFGTILMSLVLALSALPVFADTVKLTGTGPGNNSGGVYTYPYIFTVNGVTNVPLMCDSFLNEVYVGETWTANVNPITSAGNAGSASAGLYASNPNSQNLYDAAGLIYLGALGKGPLAGTAGITSLSTGLANWAIWDLFDPGITDPYGTLPFSLSTLNSLDNTALSDVGAYKGLLADVVVYTPLSGTQQPAGDGVPQEYIGMVPEPSSLLMMGSGVLGLAGFARRRFLKCLS
jgi:hypothetical protein